MKCEDVRARELVEQYLSGQLAEEDAAAYELHYFECDSCFAELEAARAVRTALGARAKTIRAEAPIASKRWLLWLAPVALAIAAGALVAMFMRPAPQLPVARVQTPAKKDYTLLAQVTPPVYASSPLRSSEGVAQAQFRSAMEAYSRGEYAAAIPKLEAASAADHKRIPPRFYLGACYLLTGDAAKAGGTLQAVVAEGPSDFLEESQWLLAEAKLKENDAAGALEQLTPVAAGKGEFAAKAQALIDAIHRVQAGQ